MKNVMVNFLADEQGAETVEWVMIAAVLAGIIIITFATGGTLRTAVSAAITRISTSMGLAV